MDHKQRSDFWEKLLSLDGKDKKTDQIELNKTITIPRYLYRYGSWQPAEDILRLDQNLRDLLGWPHRGGGSVQPWVECSHSFPHILHLRYRFDSEFDVEGAELALENSLIVPCA